MATESVTTRDDHAAPTATSAPFRASAGQREKCRALFDKHPEDVVDLLANVAEALDQLDVIFDVMESVAKRNGREVDTGVSPCIEFTRLAALAGAGRHVAADWANIAAVEGENMLAHLRKAI